MRTVLVMRELLSTYVLAGLRRIGKLTLSILAILAIPTVAQAAGSGRAESSQRKIDSQVSLPAGREAPFMAENEAAMTKMMRDMAVQPSGDIDRDFVAMMVPHHQGAIDMAVAELRYGHNEQLRRLAQEIIVTQQQEIAAMRLAIGESLPPSSAAPTQPGPVPDEQGMP